MIYDRYYYSCLSKAEKQIYKLIYSGLQNFRGQITVPRLAGLDICKIISAIDFDNPHLFYVCFEKVNTGESLSEVVFFPQYYFSKQEASSLYQTVQTKARTILHNIKGSDDYERELSLHDLLAQNIIYDERAKADSTRYKYSCTILGVLLYKCALCEGIAKTVKFLLNLLEIKCIVVHGKLLAETDICLGLYDEAIAVATEVIDYPEVSLMTDRFGSRSTEERDVYWDLFRLDNQNRSSGNKEGLWVIQYDYQNAGSSSNYDMSWALDPYYQTVMITAKDASGNDVMTTAFAGITDGKCGWGCGWMQPTEHFFTTIWEKGSENDIRNSKYNIIRDVLIDNPESPACGKWFVADGYSQQVDPIRQWYPMITKFSRVNNYPEDLYIRDSNGNPQMTVFGEHLMISSQGSYKDEYFFRLAETYLLRAEAYLMNGDKAGATADINVIRSRAHAEPATVDEVDIDYLLDERLRELYGEETRMVTLCRMGKLVERNRKYNPITGKTIEDHHNLWPIPFSEIERNTDATIEQNPGY